MQYTNSWMNQQRGAYERLKNIQQRRIAVTSTNHPERKGAYRNGMKLGQVLIKLFWLQRFLTYLLNNFLIVSKVISVNDYKKWKLHRLNWQNMSQGCQVRKESERC